MPTPEECAYLAGIIDGEGSISLTWVRQSWRRVTVTVSSCDEVLIDWLHERWGGAVSKNMDRGATRRLQHRWTIVGNAARQVLVDASPYLLIKGPRAAWGLEVLAIQTHWNTVHRYTDEQVARLSELHDLFDEDKARLQRARLRAIT